MLEAHVGTLIELTHLPSIYQSIWKFMFWHMHISVSWQTEAQVRVHCRIYPALSWPTCKFLFCLVHTLFVICMRRCISYCSLSISQQKVVFPSLCTEKKNKKRRRIIRKRLFHLCPWRFKKKGLRANARVAHALMDAQLKTIWNEV